MPVCSGKGYHGCHVIIIVFIAVDESLILRSVLAGCGFCRCCTPLVLALFTCCAISREWTDAMHRTLVSKSRSSRCMLQ
jgi:hypothetical protein